MCSKYFYFFLAYSQFLLMLLYATYTALYLVAPRDFHNFNINGCRFFFDSRVVWQTRQLLNKYPFTPWPAITRADKSIGLVLLFRWHVSERLHRVSCSYYISEHGQQFQHTSSHERQSSWRSRISSSHTNCSISL